MSNSHRRAGQTTRKLTNGILVIGLLISTSLVACDREPAAPDLPAVRSNTEPQYPVDASINVEDTYVVADVEVRNTILYSSDSGFIDPATGTRLPTINVSKPPMIYRLELGFDAQGTFRGNLYPRMTADALSSGSMRWPISRVAAVGESVVIYDQHGIPVPLPAVAPALMLSPALGPSSQFALLDAMVIEDPAATGDTVELLGDTAVSQAPPRGWAPSIHSSVFSNSVSRTTRAVAADLPSNVASENLPAPAGQSRRYFRRQGQRRILDRLETETSTSLPAGRMQMRTIQRFTNVHFNRAPGRDSIRRARRALLEQDPASRGSDRTASHYRASRES